MVCLSVILFVTELHAYDFVIQDFVIKKGSYLCWSLYIILVVYMLYVCVYVCVYMCVYVYVYTHTHICRRHIVTR